MREASRREFLIAAAGLPALAASSRVTEAAAQGPPLRPTPSCPGSASPTERQTEGPYFKPDSPLRASLLEPGMTGTKIVVTGMVLSTTCQPVARALLDVWHADDRGAYDTSGFRLRGHQFTDDQGRYRLETIVPGHYPGRTRHIHVKVQAHGAPILTSQLYFPGEVRNRSDWLFRRDLLVTVIDASETMRARFDFIVAATTDS